MKRRQKILIFAILFLAALIIVGYWYLFMGSRITDASSEVVQGEENTNSLIVYFSRNGETKGNLDATSSATVNSNNNQEVSDTEAAAFMIQELTGADLYQIKTARYYRDSFMGTAASAWIEETFNMRPALAARLDNLEKYDVIYVGYPIWWFNAPMAIGTFMESYELDGKTIVPFCTSQENGIDVSMDYIREISGNATVLDGMRIHNSSKEDVERWLEGLPG